MKTILQEIAAQFWREAGNEEVWPFDVMRAVAIATPLNIICLNDLSFEVVTKWLNQNKIHLSLPFTDRYLHGFLLMKEGHGFMFINGTDSENERRFTIAHELAHYLLHYLLPLRKANEVLGMGIDKVLYGMRLPTKEEQVQAFLNSISLTPFSQIVENSGDGFFSDFETWQAENDCDALGLELIAPFNQICLDIEKQFEHKPTFKDCKLFIEKILYQKYGVPESIINVISGPITWQVTGGPSIKEALGII